MKARVRDPEALAAASRRYRQRNSAIVSTRRRQHYADNLDDERADARERMRQRAEQDRTAVFAHYGLACACCGATEDLCIDHVNGDGGAHRAEIGTGSATTYRWLVANDFPEGFQTLCMPCNRSKNTGPCCRLSHEGGTP